MEGFDVSLLDTEEFLTIFDLAEGCIDIIVSFLWAPSETCTLMAVNTFFLSRIRKYHLRRAHECLERKWCREFSDGETPFSILRRAWAAARQPRIVLVGGNQMDRLTECFEVCIHTHSSRRDCHEEGNEEDEHEIIFPVGPGEAQHEHDAPNASASVSPAPVAMHLRRCEILPTCHFKFSEKHAVCSHNGHVWVVGGFPNGTSVCILDYITKQWRLGPCLPTVMLSTSLVCLHDALYIIGGYDQHRRLSEVYRLLPGQDAWELLPPEQWLQKGRSDAGACIVFGKVYVAGGFLEGQHFPSYGSRCVEVLDFERKTRSFLPPMQVARFQMELVTICGMLYAVGGDREMAADASHAAQAAEMRRSLAMSIERYDFGREEWQIVARIPVGVTLKHFTAVATHTNGGGEIYIFGDDGDLVVYDTACHVLTCYSPQGPFSEVASLAGTHWRGRVAVVL